MQNAAPADITALLAVIKALQTGVYGWWHQVQIMEITEFQGPLDSPWCLDGAQACPPEDVGSMPGYQDFLVAMADTVHPEHMQMRRWYGGPFDPVAFDLNEVNERLMQIQL